MMQFQALKQSIINNVLGPAESDRYITIGHQRQRRSADVMNQKPQVTVYYAAGQFPKGSGKAYRTTMHDITFIIELSVVAAAEADLSVLNDTNATADEKATALRQFKEAGLIADEAMDELVRVVYQVLMDARSADMGLATGQVASRWVTEVRKDNPVPMGEYVMLTGGMHLTCRVEEQITGEDLPAAGTVVYDADIDLSGDDTEKAGVKITNTL
jgi:hypothetical protein